MLDIGSWLSENNLVEKVVYEVHLRRRGALRPVDSAIKRSIGHVKCSFPNVRKLF